MLPKDFKLPKRYLKLNENDLFILLKNLIPDLTKSSNYYSTTDCTSTKKKMVVEMKCRTDEKWDSVLFEEKKYNEILNHSMKNKRFIVSTPYNVWSWNIGDIQPPVFFDKWVPLDSSGQEWGWKKVTYLKYSLAENITKKLGL
jgi:hypothetical protein